MNTDRRGTPADAAERQGSLLLVVDDDVIQRRVIAKIAAQAGHVVREAGSVDEAAAILASEPIDAITVDLSMGVRSGVELLTALAEGAQDIPVMIISGMPDNVLQAITRSAEDKGLRLHAVIPKPLDLALLRSALTEVHDVCAVKALLA